MLVLAIVVLGLLTLWGACARLVHRRTDHDEKLAERFNAWSPKEHDPFARW